MHNDMHDYTWQLKDTGHLLKSKKLTESKG
jgi:hypothetical protein